MQATEQGLRELFVPALAGDAVCYRAFLAALAPHLRAYFRRRLTHWPDDVEDLVQEALLAVHASRHTWQPQQPLTAWVHTIARYKLVDLLRAKSRREALHEPFDDEMQLFAHADHDAALARRDLARALAALPDRQRRLLELVKLQGATSAEAARAMGMTEGAVKVGVHRGVKALAALWKGQS